MNSFNRKIAEKFGPQRAKPKKFGCLGNFLHGALRPCIFIARHPEAEPQRYFAYAQYDISALQTLKITASGTIEKTQEELYH